MLNRFEARCSETDRQTDRLTEKQTDGIHRTCKQCTSRYIQIKRECDLEGRHIPQGADH